MTRAEIPEPDNVVYGTITLDNGAVTAARTDVVVEARRLINAPAIARYRMGDNPQVGNFYSLRLKLESVAPLLDPEASAGGASLLILVTDATGVRAQTSYTIGERGQLQRLDFGAAVPDSDGDGLPDAWELLHFGNLNSSAGALGANNRSALDNYIAGTNPGDTNSLFRLTPTRTGDIKLVSFFAAAAQGVGYEGRQRYFALESSTNPAGAWIIVSTASNILGNNQNVSFQIPNTPTPAFYRGRVWLQP
jgi:hypothetical protein